MLRWKTSAGPLSCWFFSNVLTESGIYLGEDSVALVHGRVSAREDEEPKLVCDEAFPLTDAGVEEYLAQRRRGSRGRAPYRPAQSAPPCAGRRRKAAHAVPACAGAGIGGLCAGVQHYGSVPGPQSGCFAGAGHGAQNAPAAGALGRAGRRDDDAAEIGFAAGKRRVEIRGRGHERF